MICAHHACTRAAYLRGVCMDHYIAALDAGERALRVPAQRLALLVTEMRAG